MYKILFYGLYLPRSNVAGLNENGFTYVKVGINYQNFERAYQKAYQDSWGSYSDGKLRTCVKIKDHNF